MLYTGTVLHRLTRELARVAATRTNKQQKMKTGGYSMAVSEHAQEH